MAEHLAVHEKLAAKGRLGPVARLMPTTTATTVRPGHDPLVVDGPFAETKEQLLGFYLVDCATLEEAIEVARSLPVVRRSEEHTSELQSLMRRSYAVFCLKKKNLKSRLNNITAVPTHNVPNIR